MVIRQISAQVRKGRKDTGSTIATFSGGPSPLRGVRPPLRRDHCAQAPASATTHCPVAEGRHRPTILFAGVRDPRFQRAFAACDCRIVDAGGVALGPWEERDHGQRLRGWFISGALHGLVVILPQNHDLDAELFSLARCALHFERPVLLGGDSEQEQWSSLPFRQLYGHPSNRRGEIDLADFGAPRHVRKRTWAFHLDLSYIYMDFKKQDKSPSKNFSFWPFGLLRQLGRAFANSGCATMVQNSLLAANGQCPVWCMGKSFEFNDDGAGHAQPENEPLGTSRRS